MPATKDTESAKKLNKQVNAGWHGPGHSQFLRGLFARSIAESASSAERASASTCARARRWATTRRPLDCRPALHRRLEPATAFFAKQSR